MKYFICVSLLAAISTLVFAKTSNTIRGKIIDTTGAPVPFANIILKYTKTAAVCNAAGEFSINSYADSVTLVIMAVGFVTREIQTHGNLNITITLIHSIAKLSGIITTANYLDTQPKSLDSALPYKMVTDTARYKLQQH